jgi:hypothetical protein
MSAVIRDRKDQKAAIHGRQLLKRSSVIAESQKAAIHGGTI